MTENAYAVVWRHRGKPSLTGKLELLPTAVRLAGRDQILAGLDDDDLDGAAADAEEREPPADRFPHRLGVLADPGREHERVETPERDGHCRDRPCDPVGEHPERQAGRLVVGGFELPH